MVEAAFLYSTLFISVTGMYLPLPNTPEDWTTVFLFLGFAGFIAFQVFNTKPR